MREVAQLSELGDVMRGEITGAFLLVQLPDGTTHQVTHAGMVGDVGSQTRALLLTVNSEPHWRQHP